MPCALASSIIVDNFSISCCFSLMIKLSLLWLISLICFSLFYILFLRSVILLFKLWTSQLNFCLFLFFISLDFYSTIFYTVDIKFWRLCFTASTLLYCYLSYLFSLRSCLYRVANSIDSSYIFYYVKSMLTMSSFVDEGLFLARF